jgi:hypothetical protein
VGRRYSGFLIGMGGAIAMALAGYWHDVYIGTTTRSISPVASSTG